MEIVENKNLNTRLQSLPRERIKIIPRGKY